MTEYEAKRKWCPMVQVVIGPHNATWQNQMFTNRAENIGCGFFDTCCSAGDCACWKWDSGDVFKEQHDRSEWQGHCGLVR